MSRDSIELTIAAWLSLSVGQRRTEFLQRAQEAPTVAEYWYLLGVAEHSAQDARRAAQYFGKSYHLDFTYESAALMTFACLKFAAAHNGTPLDAHIITTWNEMKQPRLGHSRPERQLIEAWAKSVRTATPTMPCNGHALAILASSRAPQ